MTFYKFSVGVVLAVAMLAVLGLSALVFSARDFQFGVAQIAPSSGGLVSFARLQEVEPQIVEVEQSSLGPRGEQIAIQRRITELNAQDTAITEARASMVGAIAAIETRNDIRPPESAPEDVNGQTLSQRIGVLASRPGLSAADQQAVTSLRGQVQQLIELEQAQDERNSERAALETRQRLVDGQVDESDRRIYALQQTVLPNIEQYERIRSEAYALRNMSPLGVSAFLAQGHPALLSTSLVLLMGALGSLLYLFPAYLNRPQPVTMAEIVVRLIFGMCAALAFYVLANAAVAGFSIASNITQATTSATLNPFTVSLVGIIAGVMSEDIAKWIQDRGRGIFTQGGAPAPAPAPASSEPEFTGVNPHGGPGAP